MEAVTTGEVSVNPYPSQTRIPAAQKTRARRGWSAEAPELICMILPPSASLHLEKISLLAIFNWKSYHPPISAAGSYLSPSSKAQKNNFFLTPVSSYPLATILSYTFSNKRGTVLKRCGCTSFKLSPMVSIFSA